jgi:hypothetical protein
MRKPGAKHDEIALLVGPEGTGKSSFVAALAPRLEWFTESIRLGDEPKELVLSLAGKAVAEISEMSASIKDVAAIKAMISRTTDAGRTANARAVTERPRRNIFMASTNDDQALMSDTGDRRFLPIRIEQAIKTEWLHANAAQMIGEASAFESAGETFALPQGVWGELPSARKRPGKLQSLNCTWPNGSHPSNAAETSESSCQGAVHTWPKAGVSVGKFSAICAAADALTDRVELRTLVLVSR